MIPKYDVNQLPQRLVTKIVLNPVTGCWEWTAYRSSDGYGIVGTSHHKTEKAHRFVYEHLAGEIPEGLQIDHLCRVRHCVNPEHLEPVTSAENSRRGLGPTILVARYKQQTHCKRGHPLFGDNVFMCKRGYRNCKACAVLRRAWRRASMANDRAADGAL